MAKHQRSEKPRHQSNQIMSSECLYFDRHAPSISQAVKSLINATPTTRTATTGSETATMLMRAFLSYDCCSLRHELSTGSARRERVLNRIAPFKRRSAKICEDTSPPRPRTRQEGSRRMKMAERGRLKAMQTFRQGSHIWRVHVWRISNTTSTHDFFPAAWRQVLFVGARDKGMMAVHVGIT